MYDLTIVKKSKFVPHNDHFLINISFRLSNVVISDNNGNFDFNNNCCSLVNILKIFFHIISCSLLLFGVCGVSFVSDI